MAEPENAVPVIELADIHKGFLGVQALRSIDLMLRPGEVMALLGDNGAGKSTLVKIIAGVHQADSGYLRVRGHEIDLHRYSVQMARRYGIETVHQDRSLAEKQPLWRNVFMGRHKTGRFGFIDVRSEKEETARLLQERLGLRGVGVVPEATVAVLSGGERQGLAIGRAMHFNAEMVILDEPTTALSLKEVGKVLDFIRQLKAAGKACLFVSHNMSHAYQAADSFYIMDRGQCVARYAKSDLTQDDLMYVLLQVASGQYDRLPGRSE